MITLVTGGARSGKSSFAEELYKGKEDVVYIGTSIVRDEEMGERVMLHREARPKIWRTFEGYRDLEKSIGNEGHYLLDCITVMASNIMFDITKDLDRIDYEIQSGIEEIVVNEIKSLINEINKRGYKLILVTNEVGSGIVPGHHISRVFRDIQGRVNQRIAALCHRVYLVCCGVPVKIK